VKSKLSILGYGMSSAGKTTQVGELARWVYKKTGKRTRLITVSGGGWNSIQSLVDTGIIEPLFFGNRDHPFEVTDRLSKGFWPTDVNDPKSKLMPPSHQGAAWEDVGAVVFESMTEIAEWVQIAATALEARGGSYQISGEQAVAKFKDGEEFYANPSRGGYNTIQNHMARCVAQSKRLVDRHIMWTALIIKAIDAEAKMPMFGPDIIGKAKTSIAPAWFDVVFHLHLEQKGAVANRRMYVKPHFSQDGTPYCAKVTVDWRFPIPDYFEGKDCSIAHVLDLMEQSNDKARAEELKLKTLREKANV
jgi:hypothetical protein